MEVTSVPGRLPASRPGHRSGGERHDIQAARARSRAAAHRELYSSINAGGAHDARQRAAQAVFLSSLIARV
jgi:hypothetical protein